MKPADCKDMDDPGKLITHPHFRLQILFVPKHHSAEKWCVFSCRCRKNLPAFFFYLKKLLSVSGIRFCFFPDHSFLHKIIDMTAGIVMLTVKATGI